MQPSEFITSTYGSDKMSDAALLLTHLHRQSETITKHYRTYRVMRDELIAFLKTYNERVLGQPESEQTKIKDDAIFAYARKLYLQLVKRHHPDSGKQSPMLVRILEANRRHELGELWLMVVAQEMQTMNGEREVLYLRQQAQTMSFFIRRIEDQCKTLTNLAAWKLKEQVFDAAQQGVDLLQTLADRLKSNALVQRSNIDSEVA